MLHAEHACVLGLGGRHASLHHHSCETPEFVVMHAALQPGPPFFLCRCIGPEPRDQDVIFQVDMGKDVPLDLS